MADVCLKQKSAQRSQPLCSCVLHAYIDFRILESLLQIIIDCLVGDLANEREVGHADFSLLCGLESCLLHLGPASAGVGRLPSCCLFLSSSALCDRLSHRVSKNTSPSPVIAF